MAKIAHNKKTHEVFISQVKDIHGNDYTVLGKYKKSHEKVLVRHNICGHEYDVAPTKILLGRRCPKCFGKKRKTHEEFLTKVRSIHGEEYVVLTEYKNSSTKVTMKHKTCGKEYSSTPSHIINGTRCPYCYGNKYRDTKKFQEDLDAVVPGEFKVLGEYKGNKTRITVMHTTCRRTHDYIPSVLTRSMSCFHCTKEKSRTKPHEVFLEQIKQKIGNKYSLESEYMSAGEKVTLKHVVCGTEFTGIPNNVLNRGTSCPKCFPKEKTRIANNKEKFLKDFEVASKGEYALLSEYRGHTKTVSVRHVTCGHTYKVSPHNFLNAGTRCPECAKIVAGQKRRVKLVETKQRIQEKYGDKISIGAGYRGMETKCSFLCNDCGLQFKNTPANVLATVHGCPSCAKKISSGELKILDYLTLRGIKHERGYTFEDLYYKNKLRFDFAVFIPESPNTPILIEFDGEQHFRPVSVFGGEEGFKLSKLRDELKNDYCKEKNLKLIRIPYWEYPNIEEIIEKVVSGF